jgi:hypothetical protein
LIVAGDPECAVVVEGGVFVAGAAGAAVVTQHDAAGGAAGPGVDAQGGARLAGDSNQRLVQFAQRPGRRRVRRAGVLAARCGAGRSARWDCWMTGMSRPRLSAS